MTGEVQKNMCELFFWIFNPLYIKLLKLKIENLDLKSYKVTSNKHLKPQHVTDMPE